MKTAGPYVPPGAGNVVKLQEDLNVSSLNWLIEELARQCPEFASYQLLKKQAWVQRTMYQRSGSFRSRVQRMESRHRILDITVDRQNTRYAGMDAVDISVRAMKCTERILNTSRDSLSARAKALKHDRYPTWPVALDLVGNSETKWQLVHNVVELCSHNFFGGKILDINRKPPANRQATAMQANVGAFEEAVGWRAQDTLLTAYGQAELQAQLQAQQQAQLQAQQLAQLQAQLQVQLQEEEQAPRQAKQQVQQGEQSQHAVPYAPELPDADGRYPHLAIELQLVDIKRNELPGSGRAYLQTTWSECHTFQAMEAAIHDVYDSDETKGNIKFVTATRNKDAWHEMDPISNDEQLLVYARVAMYEKRSLQLALHHAPPQY
ncbi:hypothetical protein KC336_g5680 [Hortaea werneckii]|nr:hypothetical protein KC336_g5680 [Hortaea werneckii]